MSTTVLSDLRQMSDDELIAAIHDTICGVESDGDDIFRMFADDFNQLFSLVDELWSRSLRGLATGNREQHSSNN